MDSETTGYGIPNNYYEQLNSFDVKFCPICGTMNYIKIDYGNNITGKIFCARCGKEL